MNSILPKIDKFIFQSRPNDNCSLLLSRCYIKISKVWEMISRISISRRPIMNIINYINDVHLACITITLNHIIGIENAQI